MDIINCFTKEFANKRAEALEQGIKELMPSQYYWLITKTKSGFLRKLTGIKFKEYSPIEYFDERRIELWQYGKKKKTYVVKFNIREL